MLELKTVRALSLLRAQKKSLWADRLKLATPTPRRPVGEGLRPSRVERAIEFELPPISEPKVAIVAIGRIMGASHGGDLTASEAGSSERRPGGAQAVPDIALRARQAAAAVKTVIRFMMVTSELTPTTLRQIDHDRTARPKKSLIAPARFHL